MIIMICRGTLQGTPALRAEWKGGCTVSAYVFSLAPGWAHSSKAGKGHTVKNPAECTMGARTRSPVQGSLKLQGFNLKAESLWEKKTLGQPRAPGAALICHTASSSATVIINSAQETLMRTSQRVWTRFQAWFRNDTHRDPPFRPQAAPCVTIETTNGPRQGPGHFARAMWPPGTVLRPPGSGLQHPHDAMRSNKAGARPPPGRPGSLRAGGGAPARLAQGGSGPRDPAWGEGAVSPACPRGGGRAPGPPAGRGPGRPAPRRRRCGRTDGRTDA